MATVVAVLDHVARMVGVTPPSDWTAATELTHVQIRDDMLRATIEDLQDRVDLPRPVAKQVTITGTGVSAYDLPANFKRVMQDEWTVYEPLGVARQCKPISKDGQWSDLDTYGTSGWFRYYRIVGYEGSFDIEFQQDLPTGATVVVSYISTAWCASDPAGVEQSALAATSDVLLLPRRIVEVGTIYRYLQRHGLPFDSEYGEYEAMIARLAITGRSIRMIGSGGNAPSRYVYPDPPAFIPAS